MADLQRQLIALSDGKYADFQAKLLPTIPRETVIGVRVPILRSFAADYAKTADCAAFLAALPHQTYDENLLHALLLNRIGNFDECVTKVAAFLPYIDNWAVCDLLRPRVFAKERERLLPLVKAWISSPADYTCRFGIEMLMTHYLTDAFCADDLALPARVNNDAYYVQMMVAWFFATALALQWNDTLPYLEQNILPIWTHNKAIQKAVESRRLTQEQKGALRELKRK